MQTHFSASQRTNRTVSVNHHAAPAFSTGTIAELVFSEDQPAMIQLMLLPLLQQLGTESRWQLWLTPAQKLSRPWLKASGLPLDKVMQIPQSATLSPLDAMNKALRTGNYSVVISWVQDVLTPDQRNVLELSAKAGQGLGLILRAPGTIFAPCRPLNSLKIPSGLYH